MSEAKYNATERGVRDAWGGWLAEHDVSVPDTIHGAIKDVMETWLRRNADDLFVDAIKEAMQRNMPDAEAATAVATLAEIREVVDGWQVDRDGSTAADVVQRIRSLLDR